MKILYQHFPKFLASAFNHFSASNTRVYVCSNRQTTIILQNDEKQRISKLNSHRHGKCRVGENLFHRNFHSVCRRYPLLRWVTSEPGKAKRKRKKGREEERKIRKKRGNRRETNSRRDWYGRLAFATTSTKSYIVLFAFVRTIRLSGRGWDDIAQTMKNVDNDHDAS